MDVKNLKHNIKSDAIKPGEFVLFNKSKCYNFEGMTKGSDPVRFYARIIEPADINTDSYEVSVWSPYFYENPDEQYVNSYEEALDYIKDIIEEYSE